MTIYDQLISLSSKLPSGSNDPKAFSKMLHEIEEFNEKLADGDRLGALLECADVLYYAVKSIYSNLFDQEMAGVYIEEVRQKGGFTRSQVEQAALIKYSLRAQPGNPKDDRKERAACAHLLTE